MEAFGRFFRIRELLEVSMSGHRLLLSMVVAFALSSSLPVRAGAAPSDEAGAKADSASHATSDSVKRRVDKAAEATQRASKKAVDATSRGIHKAAEATKRGLDKAGKAVEHAAEKTKEALGGKPDHR